MSLLDDIRTDIRDILATASEFAESLTIADDVGNILETTCFFDESYREFDPNIGFTIQTKQVRVVLDETYVFEQMGKNLPDDESVSWTFTIRSTLFYMAKIRRSDNLAAVDLIKTDA